MPRYWLDSNVFIEGFKGPYAFDIAPRFWDLIDEMIDGGRLSCPVRVYDELQDVQDDLARWVQERRQSGLFVEPGPVVQEEFRAIAAYVMQRYPDNQARRRFLDRADPWVIAHARATGSSVVTLEPTVSRTSQQVKIPNVCDRLNVRWVNTYNMLRELGVSWSG